jgi:hypothetical protein
MHRFILTPFRQAESLGSICLPEIDKYSEWRITWRIVVVVVLKAVSTVSASSKALRFRRIESLKLLIAIFRDKIVNKNSEKLL